jgi:3-dehydroquinate dehydratase-2
MARILLLNGPNLNLLGTREPQHYGKSSLPDIVAACSQLAGQLGHELIAFQSNAEHELIAQIHAAPAQGIVWTIINPGAFTHTSVALRDALAGVRLPFIEVHLSNTAAREEFRRHSYFSDIAAGSIVGLGAEGYQLAVRYIASRLAKPG